MKSLRLGKPWVVRSILVGVFVLGVIMVSNLPVRGDKTVSEEIVIFDFNNSNQAQNWLIVNDGVMGGVSQSNLVLTPDRTALFRGNVSLENNGGFASVRTYPADYDLADYEGLILHVKGDGHRYKLRLRTNNNLAGIAYQADFQTRPETWLRIRIPFEQFVPVYRGFAVPNPPELDRAEIGQIGFMISDKQAGPFQLEIDWLKAYRQVIQEPSVDKLWRGKIPW